MTTSDLLGAIRNDIAAGLREQILAELQPMIEQRLYANVFDTEEACRYLKVSLSTLRRMIKENEVPYFRQRGNIYFRQIDLDKRNAELVRKESRSC